LINAIWFSSVRRFAHPSPWVATFQRSEILYLHSNFQSTHSKIENPIFVVVASVDRSPDFRFGGHGVCLLSPVYHHCRYGIP
jgi:hypothetical protein